MSTPLVVELLLGDAPKGSAVAYGVAIEKNNKPSVTPGLSAAMMTKRGFTAKPGQVLVVPGSQTRIYVGLGPVGSVTSDRLRSAAAVATRAALTESALVLDLFGTSKVDKRPGAQAIVEGALAVTYSYRNKPANDGRRLSTLCLEVGTSRALRDGARVGEAIARSTALVRDLVNTPPAQMTPSIFAEQAIDIAEQAGFSIEVWDEKRIADERLGGLMGVAQGGLEPPRLLRLEWHPQDGRPLRSLPSLAVVGKGITFDSGGLSLKPADGMMTMKCDMAGAATTLGLFSLLATLQPNVRVIGYCVLSENLPGERATKPGDVHRARNGKTFEILNTDAEGRLVLADGLSLAVEDKVDAIVDLATLTGAVIVALGKEITGLFANNRNLAAQMIDAAGRAGEPMWELPMHAPYRRHIDSDVADMKNIGLPGQAGSMVAALFLQEFVGTTPWAHLDIAGTAWADAPHEFGPRGGTGAALRTLVELVQHFAKPER